MSYTTNQKELTAVSQLQAAERYSYFLNKVADWEEIWSLGNSNGWALASHQPHGISAPIWPTKEFAELCSTGEWAEYCAKAISLSDWLEKWIPGLTNDQRLIAVFPTPKCRGIVLEPSRVQQDILSTLEELGLD